MRILKVFLLPFYFSMIFSPANGKDIKVFDAEVFK